MALDLDLTRVQPQMRLPSKEKLIDDPALLIDGRWNEYMLIWDQPTNALWQLAAVMWEPFTCTIYRPNLGELVVDAAAPGIVKCGLDGPGGNHRAVAYQDGYVFVHCWLPSVPRWTLSGATKAVL